ncbi:MAG: branched-chain amino acid ABC transporter permease [Actinobacteria bacterium]|nr:MAG: branched-chain amino acid ABC transporter permease [Actinomycetota bacterium]
MDRNARRVRGRVCVCPLRRCSLLDAPRLSAIGRVRPRDRRPVAAAARTVRAVAASDRGADVRRAANALIGLAGPLALVALAGWIGAGLSASRQLEFGDALVNTAIVVALYVFVGNSGVISFGHVSFVAVGAYLSGILTLGATEKNFVLPSLYPWLRHTHVATVTSLALAAAIGGVYALVVGLPLMRLSGLPAGIATFAVLGITYNVLQYWEKIGPAAQALTSVPEVGVWTLTVGALVAIVVAFVYQRSRGGRMLRATREDPGAAQAVGINVYRQRLVAFTISGALAGFAGGLLMHQLGTITTDQVYLELTFLTLAMLVVGGVNSLFGAVVGALSISALDSFLGDAENGIHLGVRINLPDGTRLVVLGALMALVLILRPSGLTGGRELTVPRLRRIRIEFTR